MRVVFDHNVPHKLRRILPGLYIQTADEMGWDRLVNGVLLKTAELAAFDVMVSCDQNIYYQQNLRDRIISLVILTSNYWPTIKLHSQDVLAAIQISTPGSFAVVSLQPVRVHRPT